MSEKAKDTMLDEADDPRFKLTSLEKHLVEKNASDQKDLHKAVKQIILVISLNRELLIKD